jgi:hypothetical protein
MPLLLSVLSTRDTDGPDFKNLRVKTMECAGLIGEIVFTLSVVISCLTSISHRCWSECL